MLKFGLVLSGLGILFGVAASFNVTPEGLWITIPGTIALVFCFVALLKIAGEQEEV